ncbi:MAG: hypothetical protein ACJ746_27560 [Bryobacteraceae bacterium]
MRQRPSAGNKYRESTRRIPVREGMALQFRSEFFNVLNHTNFGYPTSDITSGSFGTIRTTYPPRQIQFALKLLF